MRVIITALFSISALAGIAQPGKYTLQQAIDVALKNNAGIKAAAYQVESRKLLKQASFDIPKTNVSMLFGQYNGFPNNDNNLTVTQAIPFTAFGSLAALDKSLFTSSQLKKAVTENELIYQIKQNFHQLAFAKARHNLLIQQDSIYEGFLKSASLRYKTGESNLLEQVTAETQRNDVRNQLRQNEATIIVLRTQLKTLLGIETLPEISVGEFSELALNNLPDTTALNASPSLAFMRQQVEVAKNEKRLEVARFAPDLQVGFFSQTLIDVADAETGAVAGKSDRFTGFQLGLSIPLWFIPHQAKVKAASFNQQAAQSNYQYYQNTLHGQLQQAAQQYIKNKNSLEYYRSSALPNAELILKQSQIAFRGGEIGYAEYLLGVRNAIGIKEEYLQTVNDCNQSIIYIEFLSGVK